MGRARSKVVERHRGDHCTMSRPMERVQESKEWSGSEGERPSARIEKWQCFEGLTVLGPRRCSPHSH